MSLDRSVKPAGGGDVRINVPEIKSTKLDNGMELLSIERTRLPIVKIILYAGIGSKLDPASKTGLAKFFSSMLDEGAGKYDDMELSDEFDLLGSSLSIMLDNDSFTLTINSLKENLDKTLDLFALILKEPSFLETAFDREKKKSLVKLLELKDDNEAIAESMFKKSLFREHPYSNPITGYVDTFSTITRNDILDFYAANFPSPDFKFVCVGDISTEEISEKLNNRFSAWSKPGNEKSLFIEPVNSIPEFVFVNKPENVQSEIRFGYITGKRSDENAIKRTMLNSIFGGQFTSRLNINLREKKGFTYGIHSAFVNLIDSGFFEISTSVKSENTIPALNEIISELNGIKNGVTAEELVFTKSSLMKKYPSQFETINHLSLMILSKIKFQLADDYYASYIERLKNISLEELNAEAELIYKPELCNIIVVGDKEKVYNDLSTIGNFVEKEFVI